MGQSRGLLLDDPFAKVNFPLKTKIFETFSAAWMQKKYWEPVPIMELIKLPISREKCKLNPNQTTRSTRSMGTATVNQLR